jgi:hypothetical protein
MTTETPWRRALKRFAEGYGSPADLTDDEDVAALMPLIEDEIRADVRGELMATIKRRTVQMDHVLDEMRRSAGHERAHATREAS